MNAKKGQEAFSCPLLELGLGLFGFFGFHHVFGFAHRG